MAGETALATALALFRRAAGVSSPRESSHLGSQQDSLQAARRVISIQLQLSTPGALRPTLSSR